MRIVLHAGVHRTGTTSLQHFLAANRLPLALQGIAYPGDAVHHQTLAWRLKRGQNTVDDVLALVAQSAGARVTVLSAEDFATMQDLDWVGALATRFPVDVVFYLRRQDHWLMSWYNQHIKWPFDREKSTMTPGDFIDRLDDFFWIDYAATLERWAALLGRESIQVGVLEQNQITDVREDFLERFQIVRASLDLDIANTNESLPVEVLEVVRLLNMFDLKPGQRRRLLRAVDTALDERAGEAHTVFSPSERAEILERFAESNQRVARSWFDRDRLFLEPPPAADAPYFRFPEVGREAFVRSWVAPVVHELLNRG